MRMGNKKAAPQWDHFCFILVTIIQWVSEKLRYVICIEISVKAKKVKVHVI